MTILSIEKLNVFYGDFQAVFDADLSVDKGKAVALIGANGAGKTSILNALSGRVSKTCKVLDFQGSSIEELSAEQVARRGIAQVPEGRRLFAGMTVRDNLVIGGDSKRSGYWTLDTVLNLFPSIVPHLDKYAGLLSGGQQQMVSIGRALMTNPDLLLVDEASLGLAPVVVDEVYEALGKLKRANTSIFFVEQDVRRALSFSDYFFCLLAGKVVMSGASNEHDLEAVSAAYFGDAR